MATEQDELRILIRTLAETSGATQTQAALRQTQVAAQDATRVTTNMGTSLRVGAEDVVRFAGALGGVTVGLSLFSAAGNALRGALASTIGTSVQFGNEIAGIGAVSGASAAQLQQLSTLARKTGLDIGVGSVQGAQGLQELIKGGVSTEQAMGGALRATELLAQAGGVTLPQAAEISSTALNAFGLSAAQLAHVADLVAGAANASSIGVEDFRQSMVQAGAVARTVGVSFDDTAVAIAELGAAGLRGSDAGTSLRTFLLSLTPTSKQAEDELRQLGIITRDGANQFFDAAGKVKSFADVSNVLKNAVAGYTDQQRAAVFQTIFGTDAIRAASVFAREGADGFNELAASMQKVSATDVARERLNSLGGDLQTLGAQAQSTALAMSSVLDPGLRGATQALTDVLAGIEVLSRAEQVAGVQPRARSLVNPPSGVLAPPTAPLPNPNEAQRALPLPTARPSTTTTTTGAVPAFTLPAGADQGLPKLVADTAQRATFQVTLVNEQLIKTHSTIAQISEDIRNLSTRSGELTAIQNALGPRDASGRAAVAAQQDLQTIDAQINARKSLLAIEQEIQREQQATRILDPRDAGGARAAQQRLDVLKQLLPAEQALAEAQNTQQQVQQAITQGQATEAVATLNVIGQRQEIARVEREINDVVDQRLALRQKETVLLAQQAAAGPQNAVDDTQAQIQRDRLFLQIRGTSVEDRQRARAEIRDLTRNALPGQELTAFDASRQVTIAQRAQQATDIANQLRQIPLQELDAALIAAARPAEDALLAIQQNNQVLQQLGTIASAVVASRQQAIQVVVSGAVDALTGGGQQGAEAIAGATADKIRADVYAELTEALGQAQQPPVIPQSGVRR